MPYQIDVTDTVPGNVLTLRRVVRVDRAGTDVGTSLAELYASARAAGLHPSGPPSVTYLDQPRSGGQVHADLSVAVAPGIGCADPCDGARIVTRHSQPVARAVHHGDYAGIGGAYRALEDWVLDHGYRSAGPPTETYLVGPGTASDPAGYRTEVCLPVRPSIGLSIQVSHDFAETVERTKETLYAAGMDVLTEVDMRSVLRREVDAEIEDFLILGVCGPRLAERAIEADQQAGLLLRCTVAIRTEDDVTVVEALDPMILVRASGLTALEPFAAEARMRLAVALASLREADQSWAG
ncbi:DUF302 domain-containing protein [Actinophytocola oryzae]|uniref:Uncharacterized protein (DUF302 family) n=1 Tax=Actinophytocola oryzae TaxID=502181 RepID=A0A4R7V042_9PSEU|nr:DUF302 domain-containing protein [Actinophytocola oryzae]TDV42569.1 uncharacterized protein (DUF302 family) [Actinophytocola oryzae]